MFESIAKTNTTHTDIPFRHLSKSFESIAKTNTTHTATPDIPSESGLRVLLKQIQHTQEDDDEDEN